MGKTFGTVKMMREIRDKIIAETQNKTFEEFKKYIDTQIKASRLRPIVQKPEALTTFNRAEYNYHK